MIEKILERLEAEHSKYDIEDRGHIQVVIEEIIGIVQEVAKEYEQNSVVKEFLTSAKDGGWHLCKDENPKFEGISTVYWVTVRDRLTRTVNTRKMRWCGKWIWMNGQDLCSEWEVVAWKPYEVPKPYRGRGE